MSVRKWQNVAVAMQSALGSPIAITAVTKAAPGVFTSVAHGRANGDYVVVDMMGMYQLNGRVFRISSVSADNFQLEGPLDGVGISTVGFDDFISGSIRVITFGTNITTATTINPSGGDFGFLDTTTIHVNQRTQIPDAANPLAYGMAQLWDISNAGQIAMKEASDSQQQRAFRFTIGTGGPIMVFLGYVGYGGAPAGESQGIITSEATITAFGSPTYYSA